MTDKDKNQTDTGIIYEDGKPRIPTPDWRVNKPGVKDSDIYTEQTGYNADTELTWWPISRLYREIACKNISCTQRCVFADGI